MGGGAKTWEDRLSLMLEAGGGGGGGAQRTPPPQIILRGGTGEHHVMRKMSDDNANVQWVSRSEQNFISVGK